MKVLVLGQGELGWRTTQILAQYDIVEDLLAADINPQQAGRTNMVRYGAQLLGLKAHVHFTETDGLDSSAVERLLADYRPDAIVNTASLQSWHVIQQLPHDLWEKVHSGGLGVWLPAHLAPAYILMLAVKNSGHDPLVVNMAFADAVNIMLDKHGMAPAMGAGNIEELVAPFSRAVAERLEADLQRIRVRMVGHHWVNAAVLEGRAVENLPLLVQVELDGRDVTNEIDIPTTLLESTEVFPPGHEDTWLIAACASQKVLAAFGRAPETAHATAVDGHPGGYPIRFQGRRPIIDLPAQITLEEAVAVNLEGQVRDGIQEITADGTAVLADHAKSVMRDVLGWDYDNYRVEDSPEMAREITRRYREFAAKVMKAA